MLNFSEAHAAFIRHHESRRSGERLRRLQEGHGVLEKLFLELVWWPAFGHFDNLHPEFETNDYRGGFRYIDFVFILFLIRLAIELDGYETHVRKLSRTQFSDQLNRQNHLIIDGWMILRFSYDDVTERSRMCIQLLQQFMGRWLGNYSEKLKQLSAEEREILRVIGRNQSRICNADVCSVLNVSPNTARKMLKHLVHSGWIKPMNPDKQRIYHYVLNAPMHMVRL